MENSEKKLLKESEAEKASGGKNQEPVRRPDTAESTVSLGGVMKHICPKCGSSDVTEKHGRGSKTPNIVYYQCNNCGEIF